MLAPVTNAPPAADRRDPVAPGNVRALCRAVVAALMALWLFAAGAAAAEVNTIGQVIALSTNELAGGPVQARVLGTVVYVSPGPRRLYVADGDQCVAVNLAGPVTAHEQGQRVEITGQVEDVKPAPRIINGTARVLGRAELPVPRASNAHRFALGQDFLRWVKVRGVVRDMVLERGGLMLLLTAEGLPFEYFIQSAPGPLPRDWLDAEIEAAGFAFPFYTPSGSLNGFRFHSTTTNSLRVLKPGDPGMFNRPLLSIAEAARQPRQWQARHRVAGTVTLHRGPDLYIDDGTGVMHAGLISLLPRPAQGESLPHDPPRQFKPGERVEVIGVRQNWYFLAPMLLLAESRLVGTAAPVAPVPVTIDDLKAGRHAGRLVSVEAKLINQRAWGERTLSRHLMMLQAGEEIFQATWTGDFFTKWDFKLGSYVRVTGVNEAQSGQEKEHITFELRMRGPEDVTPVAAPPFWRRTEYHKPLLAGASVAAVAAALILIQRRQMRRVRASEERFRALIDNSFDVTLVLNADGTVKYQSPSGDRLFGPFDRSAAARGIGSVIHPDDLPLILEAHRDVLQEPGRSRRVGRYRVVTRDGSIRYAEAIGTNCLHVPGVAGVVVNIRDITERELALQDLERSELLQRRINEFATSISLLHTEEDILWEITRQCISGLGFVDCVIYLVDDSRGVLVQKAAYGPKNPSGREIAAPIEIPLGRGIVGTVATTGQAEIIDDTSRDPRYILDDEPRLSEVAVPILSEGRVLGVIDSEHPQRGFFTGEHRQILTAIASLAANKLVRARAEAQLRRLNEELEQRVTGRTAQLQVALAAEKELNQLKSSFVSMVSHEFRTPLEVILSSSNILDRYLDRLPPDKRAAQLRAIRKSVHRMNDLIDDVLLLGKFDAGALACSPVPLDLAAFCRRVAGEIAAAASRDGAIRFSAHGVNGGVLANADEGLLHHILGNLLGNAVKYSPPGREVEFTVSRTGPDARFVVRDRGCGIPQVDQARLFTAFYRGSNVGQTPGSGLGLVITKRCVDLHAGSIRCESVEGEGTTFTVTLPLFDGTRVFRRRVEAAIPDTETRPATTEPS
jgi:PAS domain S-box-containing protein